MWWRHEDGGMLCEPLWRHHLIIAWRSATCRLRSRWRRLLLAAATVIKPKQLISWSQCQRTPIVGCQVKAGAFTWANITDHRQYGPPRRHWYTEQQVTNASQPFMTIGKYMYVIMTNGHQHQSRHRPIGRATRQGTRDLLHSLQLVLSPAIF